MPSGVFELHVKHRIVGQFVGSIVQQRAQNTNLSLPLHLMKEQVLFGLKNNILTLLVRDDEGRERKVSGSSMVASLGPLEATSAHQEQIVDDQHKRKAFSVPFAPDQRCFRPIESMEEWDAMPSKPDETTFDRLRLPIFEDLHRRGFFVSSGLKFGGDYLVYPGLSPSLFLIVSLLS